MGKSNRTTTGPVHPETKKQHFVPAAYLVNFSALTKGRHSLIYAYEKASMRAFPTTVNDIAQERRFYDLPEDDLAPEKGIHKQTIEHILSKFEGNMKVAIDDIIGHVEATGVTETVVTNLAYTVARIFLRTRSFRDHQSEGMKKIKASTEHILRATAPQGWTQDDVSRVIADHHKDDRPEVIRHASSFFDEDVIVQIVEQLRSHICFLAVNDTPLPFYTSDAPVARWPHTSEYGLPRVAFGDIGVEIFFPISSRLAIVFLERRFHSKRLGHLDRKIADLAQENVFHYNWMQVCRAHKYVYCELNEFQLAHEACAANPLIRDRIDKAFMCRILDRSPWFIPSSNGLRSTYSKYLRSIGARR